VQITDFRNHLKPHEEFGPGASRTNVKAGKVAPAAELFAEMLDDPEKNARGIELLVEKQNVNHSGGDNEHQYCQRFH